MGKRISYLVLVVGLALGYVAFEAYLLNNKLDGYSQFKSTELISTLPDTSFTKFPDKAEYNLYQNLQADTVYFIHFWATWCGPCEKEFPELVELTKKIATKKNVKFLFVAVNDEDKKIHKFINQFTGPNNFVVLLDNNFIHQSHFSTFKLPETYIFGADKALIKKFVGAQDWSSVDLASFLEKL
jgi:cytochrome c biogenesis protein CcmG, thiol:disulfide interchange protein DsbE